MVIQSLLTYAVCLSVCVAAVGAQRPEERLLSGSSPLLRGGAADGRGWEDLLQGAEVRESKSHVLPAV